MELEAAVAHLRAEIQELDQSSELMDQETEAQGNPCGWTDGQQKGYWEGTDDHSAPPTDMAMEQALQSMQDTQRHALLLRAQAGAMRRQQHGLQHPMQWLQNQLRRLQDIERWASGAHQAGWRDIFLRDPSILP